MIVHTSARSTNSVTSGLIAGTLVEGADRWLRVEDLRIGDAVQTYDGGLARVLGLDRQWIMPSPGAVVLHLPGGALDNCSDLALLPGQRVLIDTLNDPALPDAIVALMPAAALQGLFGVGRVRIEKPVEVITPRFGDDEAIFANSGTLLHCPAIAQSAGGPASAFFTELDMAQAGAFLRRAYGAPAERPPIRRAA